MNALALATDARSKVSALWRMPLHRTGYLLLLSSLLTGVLGMAFWLVVARLYPPNVVGTDSAAISAMQFLSGIAQLNMMSALVRFVPGAAPRARTMITAALGATTALSALAAVVFLAGLRWWSPGLAPLLGSGPMRLWFVVSTVAWTALVLVSPALVAVSRVGAVPVVNGGFAVGKIALAAGAAALVPAVGIWLSWTGAALLVLVMSLGYLFVRAVPAFTAPGRPAAFLPTRRDLARYIGPDYVGYLGWFGAVTITPLLVFNLAGARQAAVFTLAWTITVALYEVATAFGESQLASGSTAPDLLEVHFRQALKHVLALLAVPVALIVIAAPDLLSLFGPYYPRQGSGLLRLLALSALPSAVLTLEVARARVLRRLGVVAVGLLGVCAGVLALVAVLIPAIGIEGAGAAWLVGLTVAAAAAIGWHRHSRSWGNPPRGSRLRPQPAPPDAPRTAKAADVQAAPRAVVAAVAAATGRTIRVDRRLRTVSDTQVLLVQADERPAVLKVGVGGRGAADIDCETAVLTRLHAAHELGGWRSLLPPVLSAGSTDAGAYLLTGRIAGATSRERSAELSEVALAALAPLHRLHVGQQIIDDALLTAWIAAPGAVVRRALCHARRRAQLDRLLAMLSDEVAGTRVPVGWIHGDYHRGNVLVAADGAGITGIVDWGQADAHGLEVLDLAHWLLTSGPEAGHGELGARVAARLSGPCWSRQEWEHLAPAAGGLSRSAVLRLTWLRHVSNNLRKSNRYERSLLWIPANIHPVLALCPVTTGGVR